MRIPIAYVVVGFLCLCNSVANGKPISDLETFFDSFGRVLADMAWPSPFSKGATRQTRNVPYYWSYQHTNPMGDQNSAIWKWYQYLTQYIRPYYQQAYTYPPAQTQVNPWQQQPQTATYPQQTGYQYYYYPTWQQPTWTAPTQLPQQPPPTQPATIQAVPITQQTLPPALVTQQTLPTPPPQEIIPPNQVTPVQVQPVSVAPQPQQPVSTPQPQEIVPPNPASQVQPEPSPQQPQQSVPQELVPSNPGNQVQPEPPQPSVQPQQPQPQPAPQEQPAAA